MTRTEIIAGLRKKGYDVEEHEVVKNGVVFSGIVFKSEMTEESYKVAPIVYTSDIIREAKITGDSLDAVISRVENEYKRNKYLDFDLKDLKYRSFILNNLYISVQQESDEKISKRKCYFDGIESYLHFRKKYKDGFYSIKVNDAFLEQRGIEINEAWEYAERNTNNESVLMPIQEVLNRCLGKEIYHEEDSIIPFYVLTNEHQTNGASAILNKKLLMEFAEKFDTDKIVMFPSSIHETMIMPFDNSVDIMEFTVMVREINYTQLKPEEILGNNAYLVEPSANWSFPIEP